MPLPVLGFTALSLGCASQPPPVSTRSVPAGPAPATAPLARGPAPLERARAELVRGDDVAATATLREALRVTPDSAPLRLALGRTLLALGDVEGAVDELRDAVRRQPEENVARLDLASALMARRDWTAARAELDEVLRREPDNVSAQYRLGIVRYALGDLPGALAAYHAVIERRPDDADARYNLALMLHLARRDAEATPQFVAAADAGLSRAAYFAGAAYASGAGVPRDLTRAVAWYFRAAEAGIPQADEALAQLRQLATGRGRRAVGEREAVEQAFREFRESLWRAFPGLSRTGDESVGAALLREARIAEAVPVLIREAAALGDESERLLEDLYAQGGDPRILEYMKTAAAEGQPRARRFLQKQPAR